MEHQELTTKNSFVYNDFRLGIDACGLIEVSESYSIVLSALLEDFCPFRSSKQRSSYFFMNERPANRETRILIEANPIGAGVKRGFLIIFQRARKFRTNTPGPSGKTI